MKKYFSFFIFIGLALLISSCTQKNDEAQGYVEGYFTYISPNFSGVLQQLSVARGDNVKIGHPLFTLEQQPESDVYTQAVAKVAQAKAQIKQAEADLALSEITYKRQNILYQKNAVAKESVDTALSRLDANQAQLTAAIAGLAQAQSALNQAQWTQAQKIIAAPKNAFVFDTYFVTGELVPANQPVVSLLAPEDVYFVFFINETQLSNLHYGQTIEANCDGCRHPITAKITFISPNAEYTPPVIYSEETRAKLVFRIQATPSLSDARLLNPGQPVNIKIIK